MPAWELSDYVAPAFGIDVHLSSPCRLEWSRESGFGSSWMTPNALCIVPVHDTYSMRWNEELYLLSVDIAPSVVESTATDLKWRGGVEIPRTHGADDITIAHLCHALGAEVKAGCPTGRVFGESIAVALAAALLQRHGSQKVPELPIQRANSLTPACLNRVRDYIEAHIDDVGLDDLAQVAHLSTYYFARCFKATTGVTPHQYLLERRVERAKELLLRSSLSPMQVAAQCGFSDQSHLTRYMRRAMRITPTALVAERRYGVRSRN